MIPQRPNIVIRSPPEKSGRNMTRDDSIHKPLLGISDKNNFQSSKDYAFVLYTNMNKCMYSSQLLEIVEKSGMIFEVKDVSKIQSIPSWLTGTPVIEYQGEGYCGDLAFNFVECLSNHFKNISVNETQKSVEQLHNNKDSDEGCSFAKAFSAPGDCGQNDSKYDESEDLEKVMDRIRR